MKYHIASENIHYAYSVTKLVIDQINYVFTIVVIVSHYISGKDTRPL